GLAALMPSAPPAKPAASTGSTGYRVLPIERVHPNKTQPRKHFDETALTELVSSISTQGVLQPIVVRKSGDGYEIVAGERRWRAATRAGLHEIPAVVKEFSDMVALEVALIENLQRQDLDPLEEAEGYHRLIREHKLTHDQVAEAVGKSRSAITNALRLLKLPEPVLAMLADGRLTAGHARALMQLNDKQMIVRVADDLVGRRASVRDAETKVRQLSKSKKRGAQAEEEGGSSPAEASVEERLQRALGTKVRLRQRHGKGHIEIHFHSLDALDGLLDKLLI
ncbi:MAG TPA: ParB/RepB/Spo0J family partition protein, partial [Myxococcota bacterium]|nr:ParB/RepB/Spo0J family partition protein [Myxococcota bacterium]